MERMKEMYEWLVTWDRYVSKEDRKRKPEEPISPQPKHRRKKMVLNRGYSVPNASSSASESNTSCE